MACSILCVSPAVAQPAAVEPIERVVPLDVIVNGSSGGIWPILQRNGALFAPADAFPAWRIKPPAETEATQYKGLRYFPLAALPGSVAKVDLQKYLLDLTVAADLFTDTRLKISRDLTEHPAPDPVVPSAFLNYDLSYTRASGTTSSVDMGMLGEVGWSTGLGLLTTTFVGRDLTGASGNRGITRLETTFRRDFPSMGYTLSLGDGAMRTGLLGRNAYFGGVQFGSNFDLAPGLNRQPMPLIAGQAAAPSTVELYVNDVLRQTGKVPAGPFAIDNLPALSGNGNVTMVVRDVLGRETLITQPFYATADLLAPGLNDWSVEAGLLRSDVGTESSGYGEGFASGMWRRGLSMSTTLEGRLEASRSRRSAGVAGLHAIGGRMLVRAGAAASRDALLGTGQRWLLGVDGPSDKANYTVMLEGATRNFRSLGEDSTILPARLQLAAQATFLTDWGRFGAGFVLQRRYGQERVATITLNYGTRINKNWQLDMFLNHALSSSGGGTMIGSILTIPLSNQSSMALSGQFRHNEADIYTSASYTPRGSTGWGWRALAGHRDEARAEGGAYYQGTQGRLAADVSVSPGQTNLRLGATGALLYTSGRAFAVSRAESGAALVEVAGYPNVGVGLGGQIRARTDADGYALVPQLFAYRANPIRLDPNDLPFSAELDTIEIPTVPSWRAVSKVTFPVRGGRGALISIVFDDGQPAPPGAIVHLVSDEAANDREFYVARKGEAYLTGLLATNRLRLDWKGASCAMKVDLPPGGPDDIPRVGPVACQGVKR
jgi:outer membrane usher protein